MDGRASRPLIWIIDDDSDLRDAVEGYLRDSGFDTRGFEHGATAWAVLEAGGTVPAAIVLDNHMPVMDGLEFRRRQLARDSVADIPVILYTASGPVVVPGVLAVSKMASGEVLVSTLRAACDDRERVDGEPGVKSRLTKR